MLVCLSVYCILTRLQNGRLEGNLLLHLVGSSGEDRKWAKGLLGNGGKGRFFSIAGRSITSRQGIPSGLSGFSPLPVGPVRGQLQRYCSFIAGEIYCDVPVFTVQCLSAARNAGLHLLSSPFVFIYFFFRHFFPFYFIFIHVEPHVGKKYDYKESEDDRNIYLRRVLKYEFVLTSYLNMKFCNDLVTPILLFPHRVPRISLRGLL
jgi:hypothetical protein